MHQHMTQHASKNRVFLLFCLALTSINLFAVDIPITEKLSVSVTSNGKSMLEFPFEAKIGSEEFIPNREFQNSTHSIPTVKKGPNVVEFDSKTPGSIEYTVLGGDRPFFLKVIFEPSGEKYYRFLSPKNTDEDLKEFESGEHENIISNLVVSAFKQIPVKGYTVSSPSTKIKIEGLTLQLANEYTGNEYSVQTWIITNSIAETIELYEEMFAYEFKKLYGISIESSMLKPGESTRIFVVKSAS